MLGEIRDTSGYRANAQTSRLAQPHQLLEVMDPMKPVGIRLHQHKQIPKSNRGWREESGDEVGNRPSF